MAFFFFLLFLFVQPLSTPTISHAPEERLGDPIRLCAVFGTPGYIHCDLI